MPFVSVADACRRLGIDAKTLRRWLADAQLPLHSQPQDGRKKGVSSEHLQVLARLHHRLLAPLPQEPPAPVDSEGPALPDALLALPERLSALQAQIAALQQQVTALTCLLGQHAPKPVSLSALAKPGRRSKRSPAPAPSAPRSRPTASATFLSSEIVATVPFSAPRSRPTASATAKTPRKPTHVIPRVEYGPDGRYVVICPKGGLLPFEPDTPEWFAWLAEQSSFRFVGKGGSFSAHHEWRIPRGAWRAHRHIRNHGYHRRLASTQELTIAVLEQAAETLQAHLT